MDKSKTKAPNVKVMAKLIWLLTIWGLVVAILSLMTSSDGSWDAGGGELWKALRLPRLILGLIVGGSLALAGLILQSIFRNPLAEPYVMGISSGASLGTVIWILFISSTISIPFGVEMAGACGGASAAILVIQIGKYCGLTSSPVFVLIGIAVGAGFHAISAFFLIQADPVKIRDVMVWLMGSLAYKSWINVWMTLPVLSISTIISLKWSRGLDLLLLGDEQAHYLGLDVKKTHLLFITLAVVMAGTATAAVGIVGFVGLIAPNMIRLNLKTNHSRLIPLTLISGALLVATADLMTRYIAPNREIPIGIITSAVGCFFFVLLLKRR